MAWFSRRRATDERLGVVVEREGPHVRVATRHGSARFACADPVAFLADLRAAADAVALRDANTPCGAAPFTAAELAEARLAVAMHWARYALATQVPIRVTAREMEHPQTWDVVLRLAERKYGERTDAAHAAAAALLGIAVDELARWRRVEDERIAHM